MYLQSKAYHMKYSLAFLLILLAGICDAQEIPDSTSLRPEIGSIVDSIINDGLLESKRIGYAGTISGQWKRSEKLGKVSSDKELYTLTSNIKAVVRCYAFQELVLRQSPVAYQVLLNHLRDTSHVSIMNYDVIYHEQVGDRFLAIAFSGYLNVSQMASIDSILIYGSNIRLTAKDNLLMSLNPDPKYYSRIREILIHEKNPVAGIALSRYKNRDDIPIIRPLFDKDYTQYYGIFYARELPDSSFYDTLVKIFNHEWHEKYYDYSKWRILYQALAKYPNQKTLELFKKTLNTKNEFRHNTLCKYLLIAITKYPDKSYERFKSKIKLSKYYMDEVQREADIDK